MTIALVLPAGTTAANSSDIVVGTSPVSVYAFSPSGGVIPSGIQLTLERQVSTTSLWQPVYDDGAPVYLTDKQLDYVIAGPGRYRVRRPPGVSLGVETDDGV